MVEGGMERTEKNINHLAVPWHRFATIAWYLLAAITLAFIVLSIPAYMAAAVEDPFSSRGAMVGFSYGFPLAYPDIGLGNVLYLPRIRLQPFYDFAYSDSFQAVSPHMTSTGAEVLFDFYLSTFTVGFRYSRLLTGYTGNPNSYEVFIASQRF